MNLRIFFVALSWTATMILIFVSSIQGLEKHLFWGVSSGSVIYGILFWVFTHLWISALKKQMKNFGFKKYAFRIVLALALTFALGKELIFFNPNADNSIIYFNLLFEGLGIFLGFISIRILYSKCY